jgi:hypothetical protein
MICEATYGPDLSRAREYGWQKKQGREPFISTKDLASKCFQFLELIDRDRSGKVERKGWLR